MPTIKTVKNTIKKVIKGNIRPQEKDWATSEKAISARIFKTYRDRVTKDAKYISMRKMWREYENHNLQEIQ